MGTVSCTVGILAKGRRKHQSGLPSRIVQLVLPNNNRLPWAPAPLLPPLPGPLLVARLHPSPQVVLPPAPLGRTRRGLVDTIPDRDGDADGALPARAVRDIFVLVVRDELVLHLDSACRNLCAHLVLGVRQDRGEGERELHQVWDRRAHRMKVQRLVPNHNRRVLVSTRRGTAAAERMQTYPSLRNTSLQRLRYAPSSVLRVMQM